MKRVKLLLSALILVAALAAFTFHQQQDTIDVISYTVDPQKDNLQFYWKNDNGEILKSIKKLKAYVESKGSTLLFATNGGMYKEDRSPLGLFIQNGKTVTPLNKAKGQGNFYMQPNGVFYITNDNEAVICKTEDFINNGNIKFATQSGPMIIVNNQIHPSFIKGSKNLNIRNGVGILPNKKIIFAMSEKEVNFFDFALYFQNLGCENALYLDGFVSRSYLLEKKWLQTDGEFGVMIGVTEKNEVK
ncbi:phosphodiester glycosidase family protein [Cytophaga hutchinsonii]|jgi:uncharacterized protein YigE (DUF2233 family)|uniref:Phosphodiester glycosidase domain-containing protein n=1 Tax=Cytophaga hutchinsonii (strain ATCC 33406 / DSM 1761 / CIP 103989 / NBRC 15051 / NCIMB 9469 / D465) TaxID=269798 RepID=A0A6N4SNZ7_CYTH3|nr:phosphodiester glycosidase family protein [Cytophaga hutchinsonii]ABG58016.1 conserved hypothetical protein [Cytophaga hutchinsonii ATCC 33406]SFX11476.1 Uncharacterized protein YigE, DUF2233 family [Cytophaga hutchinsonii ATCC 33406]